MRRLLMTCGVLLLPVLAQAQLPQVQVYGQDSGTIRAVAVNASGLLSVTCSNCSGSGASFVDDAAFTAATDSGAPIMGFVTADSVDAGDAGVVAMTATRALYTTLRDSAGDSAMDDTNNAVNVNVVAGSTAGTQYTEADTDATITGTAILWEDAGNTLVTASASTPFPVEIVAGAGSGGTAAADDADFTAGTTSFTPVGGFYQSSVTACTDGDTCAAGITTGRAVKVALANADGSLITYQTDVTYGTTTYTETSSTGPLVGAVRNDTLAALANTDNEIAPLQVNADGALYVAVSNTSLTVTATNLDVQSGGADLATATQAGAIQTAVELIDNAIGVEDAAETAGGGLAMAGTVRRDTAATSAGTAGDNATLNTDALGRLWTTNGGPCADPARITHAAISESTAATNEIVALNGSDLIYVCSYKWVVAGATTLKWVRGTGTDCGTGTTDIEGAQSYAANGGVTEQGGGAPLFVVAAGNALCLTAGSAVAQGGRVSYVRTAAP